MANKAIYDVNSAYTSFMTTLLNSLATATFSGLSGVISNGTNLALLCEISLNLGSFNPSGTPYFEIHFCPLSGDGATYADASNETLVATIQVTTGSSAKVAIASGIPLPAGDFKINIKNVTGSTLAASANTAYIRLLDYNLNG